MQRHFLFQRQLFKIMLLLLTTGFSFFAQASDLPNLLTATDIDGDIETEIAGGISVNQDTYQQQVIQYLYGT